jgi:putative tryptophan/tyrosine transport system substrate-binding protein
MEQGRRRFIALIAGAAGAAAVPCAGWPLPARAQQPALPVIGFLSSLTESDRTRILTPFHRGLAEAGYAEGRNVAVEYRFADAKYERLPELAAELVRHPVAAIAAISGTPAALAAKAATATIPVVFAIGGDPVAPGLVARLDRPGGNVTGVTFYTSPLMAKRLELLRELVPKADAVAVLVNPDSAASWLEGTNAQAAARVIGVQARVLSANSADQIDAAFATMARDRLGTLLVSADPMFFNNRALLIALCARHGVPASYADHEYPEAGGLFSYGASRSDAYRQAGLYVGRILKGEKPGALPVVLPTKFDLIINLKTAKTLGITVPLTLQASADEVIE